MNRPHDPRHILQTRSLILTASQQPLPADEPRAARSARG